MDTLLRGAQLHQLRQFHPMSGVRSASADSEAVSSASRDADGGDDRA